MNADAKALLEQVFASALSSLDLERVVERSLPRRAPRGTIAVVAIGKAAPAMTAGAIARWGDAIGHAVVVAPDDVDARGLERDARVRLVRAGHPLPDARSVRAARLCLALAAEARGTMLVLISGGASALVCAPAEGVTLGDKRAVTREMLRSGATIQEINVVRKHLSRIKGGGLARAATRCDVLTLIASDVVRGEPADVGSGPSIPDSTSIADARALLRRYAARHADLPLVATLPPSKRTAERLRVRVIASPEELARAYARELRARGFAVRVLPSTQAHVDDLAADWLRRATRLGRRTALVRAAEPSVTVPARAGRGGRSTHTAALVARELPRSVTFAAFATDGVDGASGTAGAIVDADLASPALNRAIAAFDTGNYLLRRGAALAMHPTGQNLADLHVLVRT